MHTTLERLQAARNYLSDPDHWIQWNQYQDQNDEVQYCLLGAIIAFDAGILGKRTRYWEIAEPFQGNENFDDISAALGVPNTYGIAALNNNATHKGILKLLDTAIEKVSTEQDTPAWEGHAPYCDCGKCTPTGR